MNPFLIPEVVETTTVLASTHYPFQRAKELEKALALVFSRHFGNLLSGHRFETEGILVIGTSGSGKTSEIDHLVEQFNASRAPLPAGVPARIVSCPLDSKIGWKGLGASTLRALGYKIAENSRATQIQIWDRVAIQTREQGVVGIHYDEAQHIFRDKSDAERRAVLDAFKTLMKSRDWPLMLILSGVPELADYAREEPQLFRLLNRVEFKEVVVPDDLQIIHEIVGSFAIKNGIDVAENLASEDFYRRLATAAGFRWGLIIQIVSRAIMAALTAQAAQLSLDHFITAWVQKTAMLPVATPFTHPHYVSAFPRDRLFWARDGIPANG